MAHDPFDFSGGGPATGRHGPRPAERLRPGEYSPDFLHDLRAMRSVSQVPPAWDRNLAALPPGVTWVLHQNGELERVRFS